MSINERFFNLLDERNITQKEFSQKTGIPTQTVSGWKNRKTDPPAALISSIADFFNVSCDYILTGSDSYCSSSSDYSNLLNENKECMKEIGERIKLQRKKIGLTGPNLKESVCISTGTLSDIEQGHSLPSTESLMKLSKALNCSTDWILFGDSESSPIFSDSQETSLYERIFTCSTQLGITGNKLGELLGLKKSPLTDWKNGKSKPTLDQLEKMCDIFATSADYLLFGRENKNSTDSRNKFYDLFDMLSDADQEEIAEIMKLKIRLHNVRNTFYDISNQSSYVAESTIPYETSRSPKTIPILGYVAAGAPISSYENEINTIVPENSKAAYALIAKGNSMEPVIMNGENIEVISQCELENGEIGIIKLNGEITCKCFYIEGNQYELRSLNPDIAPIIVSKESQPEMQIVGKVALTNIQQKRYNAL